MNVKLETDNVSPDTVIWKFPGDINFLSASGYINSIDNNHYNADILFDLSETQSIHSSFIGLLLNTKQNVEKNGRRLKLLLSAPVKKLLDEMGVYDYLQS